MRYILIIALLAALIVGCQPDEPDTQSPVAAGIVDGVDTLSGLIAEGDYLLVKGNCLACHSGKLITQNRATREGWLEMIHWMQETQGLQNLGRHEGPIVEYLATYYAPEDTGRRPALDSVEWYELK